MTYKQQALRWRMKYEYAEQKYVELLSSFNKQELDFNRLAFRMKCEEYLKDLVSYPKKPVDK